MFHLRGSSTPWLVVLLVTGLFLLSCIEPESTDAPQEPRIEAQFTHPDPGQPDSTLGDLIIELLEASPDDAVVRAAFFTFSHEPLAQAFADAMDRGVDVQMVLGNTSRYPGGGDWTAVALLRDYLGDALTICREGQTVGGCMGENLHHNKFVTFSELSDGSRHVVLQSSGNPTNFQRTQYDNIVTVYNDQPLYEAFTDYWKDLQTEQLNPDYNRIEEGELDITVYFSPFSEGEDDPVYPVYEDISRIDCERGGEVYLAMAFFTDYRAPIAQRLRRMDQEGCQIHALLRHSDINSPGQEIMGLLNQGDVDLGYFPEEEEIQLHSKYLVYRGVYRDEEEEKSVVWTGSHNYTFSALYRNDEVLMRIVDDTLFEEFREDWHFMRPRAETRNP
jgi:phosphatidylserine/phosphatidylglycerophosphate/cardiolipin synthase-like enzyme